MSIVLLVFGIILMTVASILVFVHEGKPLLLCVGMVGGSLFGGRWTHIYTHGMTTKVQAVILRVSAVQTEIRTMVWSRHICIRNPLSYAWCGVLGTCYDVGLHDASDAGCLARAKKYFE